jgi:hypothetical protein
MIEEKETTKSQCSSKLRSKGTRYTLSLFFIVYSESFMVFELKNVSYISEKAFYVLISYYYTLRLSKTKCFSQHFDISNFFEVRIFLDTY